ncbi:unnamed protein product [Phytophthora lilii]|uniref:Unnamed protein product n=1 Tax=Phytophthora lilii TaxID=2077276 RepID=A0A9W6TRT1_9STRA|nr:unnamed protein product [Phytophthora lilii]
MLGLYPPSAFDAYKKEKTHFSAAVDATVEKIHAACDGIGTDDKALVKLLGPLSPNERGLISLRYKELHGQSLRDLVKSETSGDFGYLLQLICFTLPQAEAYILFHAMKGAGTSDHLLYSVLMGRTNEEIGLLKKAFFEMYDTDLSVAISDEISGDFLAVIMKALQVSRPYRAPTTDFHTTKALIHLFRLNTNPWSFLAEHIEGTMAGIGTDETALSAAIVRYHSYLGRILPAYEKKYKMSLHDRIQKEVSGEYQELLLQLLEAPRSVGSFA